MEMKKILEVLREMASRENIRIIYACESGSRAWGFPSTDSDYDIRFIYARSMQNYITVDKEVLCIDRNNGRPETVDWLKNLAKIDLDIEGWDIKKVANLFLKGNPVLNEWIQSPIKYNDSKLHILQDLANTYFQPKKAFYHYVAMADNNFMESINQAQITRKKYLYILRALLACRWIECRQSSPPTEFSKIYTDVMVLGETGYGEIVPHIQDIIVSKKAGKESDTIGRIGVLDNFCNIQLSIFKAMTLSRAVRTGDSRKLNEFLFDIISYKR